MKLIRTLHPQIKVLDEAQGLVEYVASDETIDAYNEVIRAAGWRFTFMRKNAPFCDSHQSQTIERLVGAIVDFGVEKNRLMNIAKWAIDVPENHLAQLGFRMTAKGYLKAVSVGFRPIRRLSRWGDPKEWIAAIEELGLTQSEPEVDWLSMEQEQIELSACILGANPNALARAYRDGCVSDSEIEAVGFRTEEDRDLLVAAGSDRMPSALRRAAQEEFLRIFKISVSGESATGNGTRREPKAPATEAQAPDAAAVARRRELGQWLVEFKKATQP